MPAGERKCNYAKCERPEQSSLFYTIEKGKSGGGQDWSSLEGLVLCRNCYEHFHKRGTLERAYNRPLAESARHCTNAQCDKPELGRRFYQVVEGQKTGGQDWSSLVGSVLCNACYCRFTRRGTLDRSHNRPLVADNKKCTYTGCARPETTSCFHQIEHGKSTGGKDWSVIAGAVLCHTCYCRFRNTGTLDGGSRFPQDKRGGGASAPRPAAAKSPPAPSNVRIGGSPPPLDAPKPPPTNLPSGFHTQVSAPKPPPISAAAVGSGATVGKAVVTGKRPAEPEEAAGRVKKLKADETHKAGGVEAGGEEGGQEEVAKAKEVKE